MSYRRLFGWGIVYTATIIAILGSVLVTANKIKTNRLPVGYVDLNLNKIAYGFGEPVIFTITNHLSSSIFLNNNCPDEPLNVYRWENNSWKSLHVLAKDDLCENQPRKIEVKKESSVSGDYNIWPDLFKQPGKYKIEAVIFNYDAKPYQELLILAPINNETNVNRNNSVNTPSPLVTPSVILQTTPTATPHDNELEND